MKTQTEPKRKQSECMENWFLCSTTAAAASATILEKLTATEVREKEKDCFFCVHVGRHHSFFQRKVV